MKTNLSYASMSYDIHDVGTRGNYEFVDNGDWFHCVVVIEGHHIAYYLNNVMIMDSILPNCVNFSATNEQDMVIGIQGGHYWNPLNGKLDDLAIYNRALTAQEISML